MRHRVAHRKLGRVTEHRIALLRNQAAALIRHESLTTTTPKAKELRPFVERLISIAKRSGSDDGPKRLAAKRLVAREIPDMELVGKLFDVVAPRFVDRDGGYTRLLRIGVRRGDAAEIARVELVGSEYDPDADKDVAEKKAEPTPKAKTMASRLRAAAARLRGKKGADAAEAGPADPRTKRPAGGRKVQTPRKVGGS